MSDKNMINDKLIDGDLSSIKMDSIQKFILLELYNVVTSDEFYRIINGTNNFKIVRDDRNPYRNLIREIIIGEFMDSEHSFFPDYWQQVKAQLEIHCRRANCRFVDVEKIFQDFLSGGTRNVD